MARAGEKEIKALVYLDNSNIFISSQTYSAKQKGFKDGISDSHCRVHLENLANIVTNGRKVFARKAFGKFGTLEGIKRLEDQGFKVFPSDKSPITGTEKFADTQLAVEAVEDIIVNKETAQPGSTVIILSGDQDMLPIIKKARNHGWNVEVWAFANVAKGIKYEVCQVVGGTQVEIKSLEEVFDKFTYMSTEEWNTVIPTERALIVTITDGGWVFSMADAARKELLNAAINFAEKIFHLPIAIKTKPPGAGELFDFALIVTLSELKKSAPNAYNFIRDVFDKREQFATAFKGYLCNKHGHSLHVLIKSADDNLNGLNSNQNEAKNFRSYDSKSQTRGRGGRGNHFSTAGGNHRRGGGRGSQNENIDPQIEYRGNRGRGHGRRGAENSNTATAY